VSSAITELDSKRLGLDQPLRLRWLATEHAPYLDYHRAMYAELRAKIPAQAAQHRHADLHTEPEEGQPQTKNRPQPVD